MRSAILKDGEVVNVIVGSIPGSVECGPEVAPGWTYSGGQFSAPPAPPGPTLEEERAGMVCSRFQAKAALANAGLLEQAEAVVAGASETAKLAWAEAIEFRRTSPIILSLQSAMGISDTELDDLFRAAVQIEA